LGEELQGVDESSTRIINKIKDKIKKNCFILSSSSSSSSYVRAWAGLECLLNPENESFSSYVLEHRAFTLNQVFKGSDIPKRRCEYFIDILVDSGMVTPQLHAKGNTKPFNVYLFKGESQDYARQALRLHNDEFAGQMGLEDSLRLEWVEEFVADLNKRNISNIQRWKIARRAIEENGGFDKNLELAAVKAVRKSGIEVIY